MGGTICYAPTIPREDVDHVFVWLDVKWLWHGNGSGTESESSIWEREGVPSSRGLGGGGDLMGDMRGEEVVGEEE